MNKLYLLLILGVIFLSIKTFAINQSTKIDNDYEVLKKEKIISEKKDIFPNKNNEQPPKKESIVIEKNQDIVHSNKFSLKIILNLSINFLKEHWIDLTQFLLSMMIIFISWQGSKIQLKSAKATHKVNQYKERLKVYRAVDTLYLNYTKHQLNENNLNNFWIEIQPSRWLFDKNLFHALQNYYDKAIQINGLNDLRNTIENGQAFEKQHRHIKNLFVSYMDTDF